MFSHIMVGADDIDASRTFYDAALGALGISPGNADGLGRIWYATASGTLGITPPIDGKPASHANGATIGFLASSTEHVLQWHAAGLAAGGSSCEDPPGKRDGSNLFLAYLRDPVGNKLCALHSLQAS